MLRYVSVILFVATACASVIPPLQIEQPWEIIANQENYITSCPEEYYINGKCLEQSAKEMIAAPRNLECNHNEREVCINNNWKCIEIMDNIVTAPVNCPPDQQLVKGKCVEVWPSNIVTVPPNCPPGQQWVNGKCVEVWPLNIVTVPPNCPPGQKWVNGRCVDVWSAPKNYVTTPPNCPPGQQWINGQCKEVWRMLSGNSRCPDGSKYCYTLQNLLRKIQRTAKNTDDDIVMNAEELDGDIYPSGPESRRIVNVPNQCPVGFRPDANGICRPVF